MIGDGFIVENIFVFNTFAKIWLNTFIENPNA